VTGHASDSAVPTPAFGVLLREWRQRRGRSQLALALEAEVSTRHLSFLETGRTQPSREMVLQLASALEIPPREQNVLLHTAGFPPAYRETAWTDPAMAEMIGAVRLILRQQEPLPARVVDRHWDLVMINEAYRGALELVFGVPCRLDTYQVLPDPRINVLRVLFESGGLRPHVANWDHVARDVVARVRREAMLDGDPKTHALLAELVRSAGSCASPAPYPHGPQPLVIPLEVRAAGRLLRFFSTLTTMGAPQDITLAELRIETFYPADTETATLVRGMASALPADGARS
jgi:transcriptional regulator with XRE-family HTH domain